MTQRIPFPPQELDVEDEIDEDEEFYQDGFEDGRQNGAAVAFGLMGMAEAIHDRMPCVHCEAEEAAARLGDADWSLEEDEKGF